MRDGHEEDDHGQAEWDEAPSTEADDFREKLRSIQFPGRGRANRSRSISDRAKRVQGAEDRRRGR